MKQPIHEEIQDLRQWAIHATRVMAGQGVPYSVLKDFNECERYSAKFLQIEQKMRDHLEHGTPL